MDKLKLSALIAKLTQSTTTTTSSLKRRAEISLSPERSLVLRTMSVSPSSSVVSRSSMSPVARNIMMHDTGRKRNKRLPVEVFDDIVNLGGEHAIALKVINHVHHLNKQRRILHTLETKESKCVLELNLNTAALQEWKQKRVRCYLRPSYALNYEDCVIVSYCLRRSCKSMFKHLGQIWAQHKDLISEKPFSFYFYARSKRKRKKKKKRNTRANAEQAINKLIDAEMRHCRFYCYAQEDGWLVHDGDAFQPVDG